MAQARRGLSHARPGASTEEVLEAAIDLLLAQQARRKALVKRPRAAGASPGAPAGKAAGKLAPRHVPAAVEREARLRDGDGCQHSLDGGGVCGSSWRFELDHVAPVALGGPTTAANLRCLCATHHRRAAEEALGPVVAGLRRGANAMAARGAG